MFDAAIEMFILLGQLKFSMEHGYIEAAVAVGVGATYAREVIQFRLFAKTEEIKAEV